MKQTESVKKTQSHSVWPKAQSFFSGGQDKGVLLTSQTRDCSAPGETMSHCPNPSRPFFPKKEFKEKLGMTVPGVCSSVLLHGCIVLICAVVAMSSSEAYDIIPLESTLVSMHVVNAGSGSGPKGMQENSEPDPQADAAQAAPKQPETPVEEKKIATPEPEVPSEAIPVAAKKVEKKPEPRPKKQEKTAPKVKRASDTKANKHQTDTHRDSKPSSLESGDTTVASAGKGGVGSGTGAGIGNAQSDDSGQGSGKARQTLVSYAKAMVQKYKRYPMAARRLGLEGVFDVMMKIDAAGRLVSVAVLSQAGHPLLKKAADQVVERIRDNWRQQTTTMAMTITVPLRYSLTDN